jgi:lipopolysaccharide/colanic/teichoic acid biosynthesis glycosyltransferase
LDLEISLDIEKTAQLESSFLRSRMKRLVDIAVSLIGLLMTVFLFPFVAIAIKLDSNGPVLFKQLRLGLNGKEFSLIKFRTMVADAESSSGPTWADKNDPRVTTIGKILRRTYIDEFPQWWNVLLGDMSMVGPRPERPELNAVIVQKYPDFIKRLKAKPGITGLAQTEYRYTNSVSDSRHKLSYDQRYILKASILVDGWIVLRTFRRMLLRRGH